MFRRYSIFFILLLVASCQSVEKTPRESSFSLVFSGGLYSASEPFYDENHDYWNHSGLGFRAEIPLNDLSMGVQIIPSKKYKYGARLYQTSSEYTSIEISPFLRTYLSSVPGLFAELSGILSPGLVDQYGYRYPDYYVHARPAIGYRVSLLEGFLLDFSLGYRVPVLPLDDYDFFNPSGFDSMLAVGVNF
jgi:hypothetical protein